MTKVDLLANAMFQSLQQTTDDSAEASAVLCTVLAHVIYFGRQENVSTGQTIETTMQVVKNAVERITNIMEAQKNV